MKRATIMRMRPKAHSGACAALCLACVVACLSLSGPAQGQAASLTASDLLQKPEVLHGRLQKANPAYAGQAEFFSDTSMGLVGDFSAAPAVADLSALQGIPFEALDLRGTAVSDLTPLRGMPLKILCLEETRVVDLAPLKGMKLEKLYLNDTRVNDLSALAGMPLVELNLFRTQVADLAPLKGMPLQSLWLNGTAVVDISPLSACPLVSLTLEETKVADLNPLSGIPSLTRLHIGGAAVTDLTPLKGLRLARLIFAPRSITKGLDVVQKMDTLAELGLKLDGAMPPNQFWALYDHGKLR